MEEALARLAHAEAAAARVKAINSDLEARNALLAQQNAKMRQELFGQRSERSHRLVGRPLVEDLEAWMHSTRAELSRHDPVAKACRYMMSGWADFTRFLGDGRFCMTNNAAERALRGIALGRQSWLFAGSNRGGERAADLYSLIVTAKLNDVDPQAWLADVLDSIAGIPQNRLHELLPWEWQTRQPALQAAA